MIRGIRVVGELVAVLVGSLVMQSVFSLVFAVLIVLLGSNPQSSFSVFGFLVFAEAAFIVMGYAYLSEKSYSLPSMRRPSDSDSRLLVLAPFLAIIVGVSLNIILLQFGASGEQVLIGGERPVSVWTRVGFVIASFLVIAPAEELFFRGAFHAHLRRYFSERGVVVIATILFVSVHIPNVLGTVLPAAVAGLTGVTLFSLLAGFAYEWTDNLTIPILLHGLYNATLFILPMFL